MIPPQPPTPTPNPQPPSHKNNTDLQKDPVLAVFLSGEDSSGSSVRAPSSYIAVMCCLLDPGAKGHPGPDKGHVCPRKQVLIQRIALIWLRRCGRGGGVPRPWASVCSLCLHSSAASPPPRLRNAADVTPRRSEVLETVVNQVDESLVKH